MSTEKDVARVGAKADSSDSPTASKNEATPALAHTRIKTGVTQCGDDWPGVFIRGDHAFGYSLALEQCIDAMPPSNWLAVAQLKGLLSTLRGCNVRTMGDGARIQFVRLVESGK